jgi:hypothetical protein
LVEGDVVACDETVLVEAISEVGDGVDVETFLYHENFSA